MGKFPFYKQADIKDCGPTCLKIISAHYKKTLSVELLRDLTKNTREGSSLLGLSDAAEKLGFRSIGVKTSTTDLKELPLPCILHWNNRHYVVLYKIKNEIFYISDPAHGLITYNEREFINFWVSRNANKNTEEGIALILEPTPNFYENDFENFQTTFGLSFITQYLFKYKKFLFQLFLGLLASSLLQVIFPFLTQSVVDIGIRNQDINFIYLILFAQLSLFVGRISIEVIRSWILLHLSTRINISLVSDFFIKLMKLPIAYFDSKMTGDIMQRINDHRRIERLLTNSSLNVLFSLINLVLFSFVLAYYNLQILLVFLIGNTFYFIWIAIFLKKRKALDYKRFSQISEEQSKVIELINGMQEIKLHNAERKKRWGWEYIQAKLFKVSLEGLSLEQYQSVGSRFINEVTNIFVTFLSAKLVIEGEITLGMMLAISYIVGQLNSPLAQLIEFVREVQDAKISIERLSEIHNKKNEENEEAHSIQDINLDQNLFLEDVSFSYYGTYNLVLQNISLKIPANQTTAIVGSSGSGKTTLMKLLLKFYQPTSGVIRLGSHKLENISQRAWREHSGVVMQEGFIFNDTIARNIAVGADFIDKDKLRNAIKIANIQDFIESLPLSYNTKIGNEGVGMSTGQKQRLLIARAVYKDPQYIFFDEATSALDAENEKIIINNLNEFLSKRTAVVIAHRLSTVRNAHQIVVLKDGVIVEIGNHKELVKKKGDYYNLIKNQLELGN
ncbi:peptidase domain-containing ABC transporter [Christiangramia sp. LLG6405-1]|uniref:peptidase domain-containing ABC transporter n=1 Tax=Christiangramia sp. LLG6405-1 TaxID=3160832 RepID=UPI00386507AA